MTLEAIFNGSFCSAERVYPEDPEYREERKILNLSCSSFISHFPRRITNWSNPSSPTTAPPHPSNANPTSNSASLLA